MDVQHLTSKELISLFKELISLFNTVQQRRLVQAENVDGDAEVVRILTTFMREIVETQVWRFQKGESSSSSQ